MDLTLDEKYEKLQEAVRRFCRESWPLQGDEAALPAEEQKVLFRKRAIAAGFLFRMVPKEYGGGGLPSDAIAENLIHQELDAAGVPHRSSLQGTHMLVPTLLECGSEAQRHEYIPRTLAGELRWCQGYSEPGSGSDLASLQSRAELHADEWVLNGQKIWTSQATEAQMMFGLFRTEPEAPKHAGISYLLVPMDTPGIDVRPLKLSQGGMDFCQVFFDDARIPAGNIVGRRGEGWKVTRATLKHERMLIGDSSLARRSFQALLELARQTGRIEDPGVRQRLVLVEGHVRSLETMGWRMLSAIAKNEDAKVLDDMVMAKLCGTNALQEIVKVAVDLYAEAGLRAPSTAEAVMGVLEYTPGHWVSQYFMSLGQAIAGGASNIQRNIIGERVLGLPRDLRRGT